MIGTGHGDLYPISVNICSLKTARVSTPDDEMLLGLYWNAESAKPYGGSLTARATLPRSESDGPTTRLERKELTRQRLIDGALALIGRGRSYTSLSLREITREAGVVPAAYYRHFRDLDELGLALVEMGGVTLRRLLREARRDGIPPTDMLRGSVLIYKRFVEERALVFRFIAAERAGGSRILRDAIRTEDGHFASEMAQDLRALGVLPDLSSASLQMICGLVVTTMLNAASDILDLPRNRPVQEQEIVDNFVRQLRVIFLGAKHWRE